MFNRFAESKTMRPLSASCRLGLRLGVPARRSEFTWFYRCFELAWFYVDLNLRSKRFEFSSYVRWHNDFQMQTMTATWIPL